MDLNWLFNENNNNKQDQKPVNGNQEKPLELDWSVNNMNLNYLFQDADNVKKSKPAKQQYEYLRFDVDEWNEHQVFEWIKSIQLPKKYIFRYKTNNINPDHLINNDVLNAIKQYKINGRKLQIFEHSDIGGVNNYNGRYINSVLFYAQTLMLKQLFVDNKPKNLYIDRNTMLIANEEYIFDDIYIKNCTLKIHNQGLLILKSLNNITLENSTIDLNGKIYTVNDHHSASNYEGNKYFGREINKIFVGKRGSNGDSCSGGGRGGGGLRLECNKLTLCHNSVITMEGSTKLHKCGYGCGAGHAGSCLIICDHTTICQGSIIGKNRYRWSERPRIVLCIKLQKMYLVHGYMRDWNANRVRIDDICNIIKGYLDIDFVINGIEKPIFVDFEELKPKKKKQIVISQSDAEISSINFFTQFNI